ncbi:MAG: helix-turn-helix domain-containing protein [Bacteroidota bacterium]
MGVLNPLIVILQVYQSALFALLAFVMFFRYGNYSKKFLGWFMLLIAIFTLSKASVSPGFYHECHYFSPMAVPLLLLLFPLFYFYLKSLIIPLYRFRNREILHLLPAAVIFLLSMPAFLISSHLADSGSLQSAGMPAAGWPEVIRHACEISIYGCFSLQIVIYSTRVSNLFKVHKSNIEKSFANTRDVRLVWVYSLLVMFLLFLVVLGISRFIGLGRFDIFRDVIGVVEFLIMLGFAVFALMQQDIYPHQAVVEPDNVLLTGSGFPAGQKAATGWVGEPAGLMPITAAVTDMTVKEEKGDCNGLKKYAGSGLTTQQKRVLGRKLDRLMKEKYYLNEKLTIDVLADKLETNSKYLSQLINESQQKNFYTYINTFRVTEAQRLLNERQHQKYSIQGIALMAGFSSKSSFNEAFRRITGMTPSEYVENNNKTETTPP